MKHLFFVSIDIDSDSILSQDRVLEEVEGAIESRFDEVNVDKWGHKLFNNINVIRYDVRPFIPVKEADLPHKVICIGNKLKNYTSHIFKVISRNNDELILFNDYNDTNITIEKQYMNDFLDLISIHTINDAATKLRLDFYKLLAAHMNDCQLEDVTDFQREQVKINLLR